MTIKRQDQFDTLYLKFAIDVSNLSYANRKKVGCVIVRGNNVLSFGFNGTPTGYHNCCEDSNGNTLSSVIHGEINAILKAAKDGKSLENSTMYITLSPCVNCALAIIQAGIKKVMYIEKYRDESGIKLLEKSKIEIVQKNFPL